MKIKRDIIAAFRQWMKSEDRKPILLTGARRIGMTWAMETFGHESFEYAVKFDFDRQPELKSVFEVTKEPKRLLRELALYYGLTIFWNSWFIPPQLSVIEKR